MNTTVLRSGVFRIGAMGKETEGQEFPIGVQG